MDIAASLTYQIGQLYRKLFPIPCFLCGAPSHQTALCPSCFLTLPRLETACDRCALPITTTGICGHCQRQPPEQDVSFSLFRYQGNVRRCLQALKYQQQLQLSDAFSGMLADALLNRGNLPQCLIPIPLHPRRLGQRGYNQALVISQQLSRHLQLPFDSHSLIRVRNTVPQNELNYAQRKQNIKKAFDWRADNPVTDHIAIIDDIMTTGHTCAEAAKVLRKHGAKRIEVWTIARAISHY